MADGGRSGWLSRETGPGKKVETCAPSLRTSQGSRGLGVGVEPQAVGCQPIHTSGRRRAEGLTDTRSARKADGNRVTMFRKVRPYQQSTEEVVQYQRAVPPGTATLPIDRDEKPTFDK